MVKSNIEDRSVSDEILRVIQENFRMRGYIGWGDTCPQARVDIGIPNSSFGGCK